MLILGWRVALLLGSIALMFIDVEALEERVATGGGGVLLVFVGEVDFGGVVLPLEGLEVGLMFLILSRVSK